MNHIDWTAEGYDGIWWADEWWYEYADQAGVQVEVIRSKIGVLKRHISSEWLKKAIKNQAASNIVIYLVVMKGLQPLGFLLHLADLFEKLSTADGFERKLKELATNKSEAVLFELATARIFVDSASKISFPKEGKEKQPDILVKIGSEVFQIECKRLEIQGWETWAQPITKEMVSIIDRYLSDDEWIIEIILNKQFTDLFKSNDNAFSVALKEQLLLEIENGVKNICGNIKNKEMIRIGDIADICLLKKTEGNYGSVSGYNVSLFSKTRRLLDNGVTRALEQLDNASLGMISVFADSRLDSEVLRLALDAYIASNIEKTTALFAILVFPRLTIFENEQGCLYVNSHCECSQEIKMGITEMLLQQGNLKSINMPNYTRFSLED